MPTYDYQCGACGHRFEELQSFSEPPLKKCPECKKNKLERLFGGGGAIIFKGSGFYETDYRRAGTGGKNGAAKTEGDAAPKTETKADSASGTAAASESTGGGSAAKSGGTAPAPTGK